MSSDFATVDTSSVRTPNRVADAAIKRFSEGSARLSVFWIAVNGGRQQFVTELGKRLVGHPIVAVVLRGSAFNNPNSLVEDALELLEMHRAECLAALTGSEARRLGLIIVARSSFVLGQSASPAVFPEWLCGEGEYEGHCIITDLTSRLYAPFNAGELTRLPTLHKSLYDVEGALIRRFIYLNGHGDRNSHIHFFDEIRRPSDVSWDRFLALSVKNHQAIPNPSSYRPSRRTGSSVVSRLWVVSQEVGSKALRGSAARLEGALELDHDLIDHHRCLAATLFSDVLDAGFAYNLIRAVGSACQLFTLEAHSESSPQYPVDLLALFIDDIYWSLVTAESVLNAHIW